MSNLEQIINLIHKMYPLANSDVTCFLESTFFRPYVKPL